MKHYWADYSSQEFSMLNRANLIAVLPVGATEQHGPHLPLSVDTSLANGVVKTIIERMDDDMPVLFLPTQQIGKSNEHMRFPGTLTFSAETLIRNWTEIGDCVAASGVKKLVLLNSHGGQISIMDIVARDLRIKHNMMVVSSSWFTQGLPEFYNDDELRNGIHAGDMETSMMLALKPELVKMEQAEDFKSFGETLANDYQHLAVGSGGKLAWQIQDMNASGACGNATKATAQKGEDTLIHAADRFIELLYDIQKFPLAALDTSPSW